MASPNIGSPSLSSCESFSGSFNLCIDEANPANILNVLEAPTSISYNYNVPKPPPLPSKTCTKPKGIQNPLNFSFVLKETKDTWDKLFQEGNGADMYIITENESYIPAHSSILTVASPVMGNILRKAKVRKGRKHIKILGVPYEAVYAFIRYLYSSCHEKEEIKKFALHLLVLSHFYRVPSLKRICVYVLEHGWLTKENVVDVLQLAKKCDAPRLSLICVRMIVKDFKSISSTEGWKVMKRASPALEQELIEYVVEAGNRKEERQRKREEKKVYLQLHEAMEALLHICRDGCRTIGPRDKVLKENQVACNYTACKGLETLVRHFSICKTRVPGGCVHCKRMWQLLELHSRMCDEPESCKVPLCRHFKEKMRRHTKKDESKWRLLVSKVTAARISLGPFSIRKPGIL